MAGEISILQVRVAVRRPSRKFLRTWQALVIASAIGGCDPNVVIGEKWPRGAGGTGDIGGAPAVSGSGGAAVAGDAVGGSGIAGEPAMPIAGAMTDGGAGGVPDDGLIFNADQENGAKLTQWDEGPDADAGGYYADGGLPVWSTDQHHSGEASVEVTIDTTSGVDQIARLYRRVEQPQAYYAAWFFLNEDHTPGTWWSVFLFRAVKDRNKSIDLWSVDLVRTPGDTLTVALFDHANNDSIEAQGAFPVPVRQWFQLQAYLQVAEGEPSHLTLWLDGVQFLDLKSTTPAPAMQPLYWVIGNGGSKMTPPVSTLYVDDAQISTSFLRP
ncbi:MAG TPA: hypothetical protein VM284_05460 [Candidatus Limnocylindria bacterium]|nr:hypothetical protein [Candidatus Limnocylindria bacterium]